MDFICTMQTKTNYAFQNGSTECEVFSFVSQHTHATCSFSISRSSASSSHGLSASMQILLPTVGRSDGKNGIIDIMFCAILLLMKLLELQFSYQRFCLLMLLNIMAKQMNLTDPYAMHDRVSGMVFFT